MKKSSMFILTSALLVTHCGGSSQKSTAADATPSSTEHQHRWWLEKVARALHSGRELTDPVQRAELLAGTDVAAVERLQDDSLFYDTVADFSAYFLGVKNAGFALPKRHASVFASSLAELPQAVEAAHAVHDDGDILRALTEPGAYYLTPSGNHTFGGDPSGSTDALAMRSAFYESLRRKLDEVQATLTAGRPVSHDELCVFDGQDMIKRLTNPIYFTRTLLDILLNDQLNGPMRPFLSCFGTLPHQPALTADLVASAQARLSLLIPYLRSFDSDHYWPEHVLDIRRLDKAVVGPSFIPTQTSPDAWFWQALPNSSTNRNRRRAAYVLKRYFCDDLTPVQVVSSGHGRGQHAADPACQACHYKLDPLAGFFRAHGQAGERVVGSTITFDDGATARYADYAADWRAAVGGGARPWAIGFVRSTTKPALNDYGDHPEDPQLADLAALIRRAPEVKMCFVRRLYEYFTGEGQAIDPAFIESETRRFTEQYAARPGLAVKNAIARVVLSRTFRTEDPVSEECYDRASGGLDATLGPPCRVAAILERYCASCHNANASSGGLDLTTWVSTNGQAEPAFPHQSPSGQQLPRAASLKLISKRLEATDPEVRMPLGRDMPRADLDALFLWLNKKN